MNNEIKFTVQYSADDLALAYKIYFLKARTFRTALSFILAALVGVLGIFLFNIVRDNIMYEYLAIFFICYSLLMITIYLYRIQFYGRKIFKKMPEFKHPFEYVINDEGVHIESSIVSGKYAWEHFTKALLNPKIILLFPNKFRFNFFHIRHFQSKDDFLRFGELVKSKIVKS